MPKKEVTYTIRDGLQGVIPGKTQYDYEILTMTVSEKEGEKLNPDEMFTQAREAVIKNTTRYKKKHQDEN